MRNMRITCRQNALQKLLLGAAICLLPAIASASPQARCLGEALGGDIYWDRDWQSDGLDHNVLYTVKEVIRETYPPVVIVSLVAKAHATKKKREARITSKHVERMFCLRLVAKKKEKKVISTFNKSIGYKASGEEISLSFKSREAVAADLVFRAFHDGAWVPAKQKLGEKVAVCVLPTVSFACSLKDYALLERHKGSRRQQYSPYYKMLLPNEFIRYRSSGWRKADPIGLPADSLMSECKVGGTKYSCLSSEKKRYSKDLAELNQEVEFKKEVLSKR